MNYIADLHIHSRFSMATSKKLSTLDLAQWAGTKGINVLGTGDFTHPAWRQELKENLEWDGESGFYKLKKSLLKELDCPKPSPPLFCLQTEISSIYKKNGKVRKVHNLIYAPDFETADLISQKLAVIGNINSDGRPILGLDSRDLLEIILECSPKCVLVPAHIWTPWFALFGSKSGFDRIEDCYEDLTSHIFALETGLSSDPPMNRCLAALDNYALISNSDAHSGANLGREANLFQGQPSYDGMFQALRISASRQPSDNDNNRFLGTLEFYPEEGKYHLDGHRNCNVVLNPAQSRELNNTCPVCGKPLTIGVLHRVMELADRIEPPELEHEPEARMLVPLAETLAQILNVNPSSAKVGERYLHAIEHLGPELDILCTLPLADVRSYWEPLGEAVARIRSGNVRLEPGFDGQYGIIRVFDPHEQKDIAFKGLKALPGLARKDSAQQGKTYKRAAFSRDFNKAPKPAEKNLQISSDQMTAINADSRPTFVLAGPGTGKTFVLVQRVCELIERGVQPEKILVITFTRRAAGELRARLAKNNISGLACDTLHGLAYDCCRNQFKDVAPLVLGEDLAFCLFHKANREHKLTTAQAHLLWRKIALSRETRSALPEDGIAIFENYKRHKAALSSAQYLDYTDLLEWFIDNSAQFHSRWEYLLVDEAQDLSPLQIEMIQALLPTDGTGFFGIGDPDQSIYEFRGAGGQMPDALIPCWPQLNILKLGQSYRACGKILEMSNALLGSASKCGRLEAKNIGEAEIKLFQATNPQAEANWIASQIKKLLGSTSHSLQDQKETAKILAPGDIAVLVRLKSQISPIADALEKRGIPYHAPGSDEYWQDELCTIYLDFALSHAQELEPEQMFLACAQRFNFASELWTENPSFKKLCKDWNRAGSWKKFFQDLAWKKELEMISSKGEYVNVLTMHASKGLEFNSVFIAGLDDGLIPFRSEIIFPGNEHLESSLASEERLLYVGLTRASERVFLTSCKSRNFYGQNITLEPSPFLQPVRTFCEVLKLPKQAKVKEQFLSLT